MKISFFETRTRNSFFQSRASRREREFLFSISCFETKTRNRKSFLMVEREKIKLILTRIPGIENSRYALTGTLLTAPSSHFYRLHHLWLHLQHVPGCKVPGSSFSPVLLAPLWLHCLLVRLHARIVPGDTEQDTGEAEWGN